MKRLLSIVLLVLFVFWALFVIGKYYQFHLQYLGCLEQDWNFCMKTYGWRGLLQKLLWHERVFYLYGLILLSAAAAMWYGKKQITLRLRPVWLIAWFFLFSVISLHALLAFVPSGMNTGVAFFVNASIIAKLSIITISFLFLLLTGASIGSWILKKINLRPETLLLHFLFSVAVGWFVWMMVGFVLLLGGIFTVPVVGVIVIGQCILTRRELLSWIQSAKHRFTISFNFVSLETWVVILLHGIAGYSLLEGILSIPVGWDATYRYMNIVNVLSAEGRIIPGISPYPFEILLALGPLIFGTMMTAIAGTWLPAYLSGIVLYLISRKILPVRESLLVVLGYATTPFIFFLAGTEAKIDFGGLFFALLAVLALFEWQSQKKSKWLYGAGLLMGIALVIKLSYIFVAAALGMVVLLLLRRARHSVRTIVGMAAFTALLMLVPLAPWLLKNLVETGGATEATLLFQGASSGPHLDACSIGHDDSVPLRDMSRPEENLYWGTEERTFGNYLHLPWRMTMNTERGHPLNQLGPIFLVFLPFLLVPLFRRRHLSSPEQYWMMPLMILVVGSLLLWIVIAFSGVWYVMPAWALFVLLFVLIVHHTFRTKPGRNVIYAVFILCTLVPLLYRAIEKPGQFKYQFISGFLSTEELRYLVPPQMQKIADVLNADAPTADDPKYIYNIGSSVMYRIPDNFTRLYNDHYMVSLACIFDTYQDDADVVLAKLREEGFAYLIVDPNVTTSDPRPDSPLIPRSTRTATFVNTMIERGEIKRVYLPDEEVTQHFLFDLRAPVQTSL